MSHGESTKAKSSQLGQAQTRISETEIPHQPAAFVKSKLSVLTRSGQFLRNSDTDGKAAASAVSLTGTPTSPAEMRRLPEMSRERPRATDKSPTSHQAKRSKPANHPKKLSESAAKDQYVRELFRSDFPKGYVCIATSGEGSLCGLRALIASIKHQALTLREPLLEELKAVAEDPARRPRFLADTIVQDTSNFTWDDLASIARTWASQQDVDLIVGVLEGSDKLHLIEPDNSGRTRIRIWVWLTTGGGHFEGLKGRTGS
ncbi:hypothetical protein ONS96_005296 [Cadophora gregata f. sp. sojae]|nr:hypothetical protein ONS96_005296 [Cadophora gregata f. sp. sojae]